MHRSRLFLSAAVLVPWLASCAETPPPPPANPPPPAATTAPPPSISAAPSAAPAAQPPLALPAELQGKAVLVPKGDPDEARADLAAAVKPAGEGGISHGLVVRLTADIPVWRMWNGPDKKDANGRTNRLGQWWSYDAPHGTQQQYRTDYEICLSWNDLTYVAKCTLKKGAVVAIGPGQSVSPKTCGDATGREAYPANPRGWQVYIAKVWARPTEFECPPDSADYLADPADISRKSAAKPAAATK